MKRMVIVGGGFAGAFAAKSLLKRLPPDLTLTLINPVPFFTFKPLLHEVATGVFGSDVVCERISSFLHHRNFEFVKGSATGIDLKMQEVAVGGKSIRYDLLIISVGSCTNFFNVPGAEKHSLKLETLEDAFRIKNAIIDASRRQAPSIVVVGAGPTGSEVSAEISEFMRQLVKRDFSITVVNRPPDFLPQIKEKSRALVRRFFSIKNVKLLTERAVTEVGNGFVATDKGERMPADVVVWAAGVRPARIAVKPAMELPGGYFPVDSFLRLHGYENVFAVGDCALAKNPDGSPVPQLAQSASEEGAFVAYNALASVRKKPLKKFIFRQKGFLLPLGKGNAIAELYGLSFDGFLAWWLNRTIYLMSMFTLSHRLYVAWNWTLGLFTKRDTKKL